MSAIPSDRQIRRNFRQDVRVSGWRGKRRSGQGPLVFTGAQRELFDYLMGLAAESERQRDRAIERLRTRKDVLARAARARRVFRQVQGLGKLPPRTPLRARTSPAFVREGYRVEHVILESRPRYFVTGNLYLPSSVQPPYPAVLVVQGHAPAGKANYHPRAAVLARKGLAAFLVDPAGQGERDEYVDIRTGRRTVARACRMHAVAGDPVYLTGGNFGGYRLWDGMRCVDYLQGRPDVLASRIGVAGCSGGGWESLWLGAIDTRIKAINSNVYLTTWRRRMESRGGDAEPDPEQDPFGVLAAGLDAADLLVACIPRAVSLGATTMDIFPADGALKCYRQAKELFRIAGVGERIAIAVSDAGHAFTPHMHRLRLRWMLHWLAGQADPDDSLPDGIQVEPAGRTHCTHTGIVLTSIGGLTTAEHNAGRARRLALARQHRRDRLSLAARARATRSQLRKLLRYEPVAGPLRVRKARPRGAGGLSVSRLKISTDGGLWLTGHLWQGAGGGRRPAVIALAEKPKSYDPLANPLCRRLARSGAVVLDLDGRGMGPMEEVWLDFVPLIEGDLTYDAFLLGRTVLGMRVADVIRAVDLLAGMDAIDPGRIGLCGSGYGALLALLAACLDDRVGRVVEVAPLTSYSSLAWHRDYAWPANVVLPGMLESLDLEDVRASLAPRPLAVVGPLDHLKRPLTPRAARAEFALPRQAYRAAGAARRLRIAPGRRRGVPEAALKALLGP